MIPIPSTSSSSPAHRRASRLQAQRQRWAMRVVGALVGLTLAVGGLGHVMSAHAATPSTTAAAARHGTVQDVQPVEVKGQGSGAGVVAGAVLGGLVGNQFGKGTGNAVTTVGGAVAGGYAGNEVEKHVRRQTLYKTTVKLDDGTVRHFTVGRQYAVGARVTVKGKTLHPAE